MIYFARNERTGAIKIGHSRDPEKRVMSLQTANADPIVLMAVAVGDRKEEADLHRHFSPAQISGEWFQAEVELMVWIQQNAAPFIAGQFVNVWMECKRRGDCRYGLQGVPMRHNPTEREFVCGGSRWDRDRTLMVLTRREELRFKPGKGPDDLGFFRLGDIVMEAEQFGDWVRADECLLLGVWPRVCC